TTQERSLHAGHAADPDDPARRTSSHRRARADGDKWVRVEDYFSATRKRLPHSRLTASCRASRTGSLWSTPSASAYHQAVSGLISLWPRSRSTTRGGETL